MRGILNQPTQLSDLQRDTVAQLVAGECQVPEDREVPELGRDGSSQLVVMKNL